MKPGKPLNGMTTIAVLLSISSAILAQEPGTRPGSNGKTAAKRVERDNSTLFRVPPATEKEGENKRKSVTDGFPVRKSASVKDDSTLFRVPQDGDARDSTVSREFQNLSPEELAALRKSLREMRSKKKDANKSRRTRVTRRRTTSRSSTRRTSRQNSVTSLPADLLPNPPVVPYCPPVPTFHPVVPPLSTFRYVYYPTRVPFVPPVYPVQMRWNYNLRPYVPSPYPWCR